jgi:hypothetical protein
MQAWTIKDDKVYTITYVAEEEDFQNDFQIAQKMIQSFELIVKYERLNALMNFSISHDVV